MVETLQLLRKVPVFDGLPEEHLKWFLSRSQEFRFKPGETYSRQGDPADAMFVVLEGDVQGRTRRRQRGVADSGGFGHWNSAFSRMKTFTLSGSNFENHGSLKINQTGSSRRIKILIRV